ncbi:MAG: phosphopantetheine-binding protein [Acidobacteriota bacterium]
MQASEIQAKIKEIIGNVANLDPSAIADNARFIDDLSLDSLAMMEIGVDMDYAFKLGLPDESFQELRSVDEAVALVLRERQPTTVSA